MQPVRNVMLVEDSEEDLILCTKHLISAGIQKACIVVMRTVPEAIDYLDCLDISKKPRPDLILIDFRFRDVPGMHLLRWLRDRPRFASVPRVVLSSWAPPFDVDRAYAAGANCYFEKPSNPIKAHNLIRSILEFYNNAEMPSFAGGPAITK